MRVAVVGSNPLVDELVRVWKFMELEFCQVDPGSIQEMLERLPFTPDYVVCASGMTQPVMSGIERRWVEEPPKPTQVVENFSILPTKVALFAKGLGAGFIHLSSELVFSGSDGPYRVTDRPRPSSQLGLALWWGELGVRAIGPCIIVRLPWVYSRHWSFSYPTKVLEAYGERVTTRNGAVEAKAQAYVPHDAQGTPIPAAFVALSLYALMVGDWGQETMHVGPEDSPITWYQFCQMIGECKVGSRFRGISNRWGLVPSESLVALDYQRQAAILR